MASPLERDLEAHEKAELAALAWILYQQQALAKAIRVLERKTLLLLDEKLAREDGRVAVTGRRLAAAQKLHKPLARLFQDNYEVAVASLVKGLVEAYNAAEKQMAILVPSTKFSSTDLLRAFKEVIESELAALGAIAYEDLVSALYDATFTSGTYDSLRKQVSAILTGSKEKLGRPLTTIVEMAVFERVMEFRTQLIVAEAGKAGIEHFLYYGFIQNNTRSFCRRRVGNIYAKTEIESWTHTWDGKSGPAMTHRGGYNCKHTWIPVRKDWFEDRKDEIRKSVRQ